MIVYGCCVSSWDKFQRNVAPISVEPRSCFGTRRCIPTSGHSDIATAYNMILDAAREWRAAAVVLLHDDLEITEPQAEEKFAAALEGAELVGVAGSRNAPGLAWWDGDTVGHQLTDHGIIDFGERTGPVTALEGSIMVLGRTVIEHVRFDTGYTGFHGYDCDLARQVNDGGGRVVVANVDTHHHTTIGWKSEAVHASWLAADKRYREKWNV